MPSRRFGSSMRRSAASWDGPLFFASDVPDGVASLVAPEGHVSRVTCRTLTLDRFAEEDGERLPILMKVDVEGPRR